MFKRVGFDVLRDGRGPSISSFDLQLQRLADETTDCILASGAMFRQDMAGGFSLSAVLPRQSGGISLVAALGALHSTPANPLGLEPGATLAIPSLGQESQLLALRPDLEIVKPDCPLSALRAHTLGAIVVPTHEINSHGPESLQGLEAVELGLEIMLPPPGEGTTIVVTRTGDPLGDRLKSLDDTGTRRCLTAEISLADALGRPADLACLATEEADGAIRLQATLAGDAPDPRSALARVGVVAATPEAAAELCRFALEECLTGQRRGLRGSKGEGEG